MTFITRSIGAGLFAAALAAGAASAQVVTIATGAQGSLAYNSGQAVAKVANEAGIIARTQPLVGYLPLINAGEVDFGFSNAVEAEYAYTGTGNYDRPHPNIRLVGVMFPLTTGIMAPCDLGLKSVEDLKARAGELRIASEYTSSTIIPFYIAGALANAGISYDDFQQVPVASFVAGINALGDGLVDIALVSLNAGAGQQAAVKLKDRGGLCYISLDNSEEGVARFKEYLPAGSIVSLPQNDKINGLQNYGANIMQIPWVMLTHAGADEELVYRMVKAVAENKDKLAESFGLFRLAKRETMAPASRVPYHPGALRYYAEAGIPVGQ
ncbi:TRAP transporter solute receptor, TAXI family [Meinhardsimonia xiamenensis]|jgi:TRAP transporter TAXI family solute receptor|uniref:TRAP transporter solute receptor, TAXI family n=1 Tax=Meinhardsimonia xiamenensis TaxID=990712 RepID=A0A1G9AYC7_9RHOB|nr:TAXI family TRAP transporter solute-binding subunit [Meinhardsimonia xiamenensis]PRX35201.1 TRAP transporter TAXI family solute receptor [Meinhardsimonia xiamenensis]SDK32247.1 TRAP transporter solute receptor, TAXI family [Meinhardsimonia xiamenensis]